MRNELSPSTLGFILALAVYLLLGLAAWFVALKYGPKVEAHLYGYMESNRRDGPAEIKIDGFVGAEKATYFGADDAYMSVRELPPRMSGVTAWVITGSPDLVCDIRGAARDGDSETASIVICWAGSTP